MSAIEQLLVVNNIKLPINASVSEAFSVAEKAISRLGLKRYVAGYSVFRRSIDARRKENIHFVYSIAAHGIFPRVDEASLGKYGMAFVSVSDTPDISIGEKSLTAPPVIVGSGPAGLFAALLLAECGYAPVILERGGSITERKAAVDRFNKTHVLCPDTNIQFGAGGAGTFSDGKLITRINDTLSSYVLRRFVEFGAPSEIQYIAKPHIGTDVLSVVIDKMIDRIVSLGGRIEYHTTFIRPIEDGVGRVRAVITSRGELAAGALILAVGHSARDTYGELMRFGFDIKAKDFSVGMRIEHLAEDIDAAMYGASAVAERIGHAEYALSHDTKNRGTYTFCMCPGGEVVAAASEDGGLVVNGMSYNSRRGRNSNSAIVSTVFKEDYGSTPEAAIEFQRRIERAAFLAGGGDYRAPIITVGDFLSGKLAHEPKRIMPSYMGGSNVKLASPEDYLPDFTTSSIRSALLAFDRKIKGFAVSDAVLTGAETRTSAPIRIMRDPMTRLASGYKNIYPSGEGAGYAGGITSAAIDGIKSAIALMETYKPKMSR